MSSLPKVAIIGRVNVGKSTLFNRLIESKKAIISSLAGTTRDQNHAPCEWRGVLFELIDTPGIENIKGSRAKNELEKNIAKQANNAIKSADLILFILDSKIQILPQDKKILSDLRKSQKPFIVVGNKADTLREKKNVSKLASIGEKEIHAISAANGTGTGDLLDEVVKCIAKTKKFIRATKNDPDLLTKVAILGKPNVGKSSLFNKLAGKDLVVVSELAHTTREPHDTLISYEDNLLLFIDTAGLQKKRQVKTPLQKKIYAKSFSVLKSADIALFLIDISEPMTTIDKSLLGELLEHKVSTILVYNKWDKIPTGEKFRKEFDLELARHFPFARWLPNIYVSAKTGAKVNKVFDLILDVKKGRNIIISENAAEKFIKKIIKLQRPIKQKGVNAPYIHAFKQIRSNPPVFELRIGIKQSIAESYLRFIEKKLREKFDFLGTPIKIIVRKSV